MQLFEETKLQIFGQFHGTKVKKHELIFIGEEMCRLASFLCARVLGSQFCLGQILLVTCLSG